MGVTLPLRNCCIAPFLFAGMLLSSSALSASAADALAEPDNPFRSVTAAGADGPRDLHWDVYMSGYAYHDRNTYTRKQLNKMNENTWGGGLGRTLRNSRGNDESLYGVVIRDSNNRPQWMAGYAYQWMFPVVSKKFEVGAGLTGLLIRRHDWYEGRPFPAILPVASIGTPNSQLVATYVPHLSMRKAKGNIVLLMLRMSL
jgi:palmitoyl transferase